MQSQIALDSVTQRFLMEKKQVTLFENISLTLDKGQSMSIVGPSGAGKSSLLLLLAGLAYPTSGVVNYRVNDKKVDIQQLRTCSGFVFQHFHLLPELCALDNVALPLKIKGDSQAIEKAQQWLTKVGLAERAKHKPNELSGGEQQRVAIARAFISQPDYVFADEPTGNLDKQTASDIIKLMFNCAAQSQASLIYVTHNEEFAAMAHRTLSLAMLETSNQLNPTKEAV